MVTDRVINFALGMLLVLALIATGSAVVRIMQLNHEIGEANKTIAALERKAATLGAAVTIQNAAVDGLAEESARAIAKSEQALADLQPFIEEEERRILGIRGAQQSSVSADANEHLENIRQKMLKDALL